MTDPFRPLKDAFGRFATGVTIAACASRDGYSAITVNSFSSVSLAPPLVLWCIEKKAPTYLEFMAAEAYAISVLRAGQEKTSERFASHKPPPIAAGEAEIWETGAPLLKDRLAGFDCRVVDRHRSGDHVILVAKVLRFDAKPGAPLLYFGSRYFAGPSTD